MKKMFKPLSAIFMSAAIAASAGAMTAMPAFAADHSISVSNADGDEATHEYIAYQVFAGTLGDDESTISNIQWGNGVKPTELLAALKAAAVFGSGDENLFKDCATADQVAVVIENFSANSAEANAFADIVAAHLSTTSYNISSGTKVPEASYYFIKDTITTKPDTNKHYAYSDHILKVVTNSDLEGVKAKADVPSIEKKIGTVFASGTKASTASIGDKVPFVLESAVPDMSKYNDYYFIITDTMSDGLTFNNDVAITVGEFALTKDVDFTVEQTGQKFQIVFKNFYEELYLNKTPNDTSDDGTHLGEKITVTYSATLNEKADITSTGNPNTVDLTYSNNPNHTYGGGDKPTDDEKNNDDVIGKTPESKTNTFTTGLKLIKKDATTNAALEGAKFKIEGTGVKAVIINNEIYKEAEDGTYYMLKNGTFTETASTAETIANYDSTTTKYKLISTVTADTAAATNSVNQTAYSDTNGVITFVGLTAGTYTITELEAPEHYNKLSGNIVINIEANLNEAGTAYTWAVKKDGTNIGQEDNLFKFEVENNKGMTLPGTGGIGTTIFYIVGALLVSGALVLLITKKRMNIKEK